MSGKVKFYGSKSTESLSASKEKKAEDELKAKKKKEKGKLPQLPKITDDHVRNIISAEDISFFKKNKAALSILSSFDAEKIDECLMKPMPQEQRPEHWRRTKQEKREEDDDDEEAEEEADRKPSSSKKQKIEGKKPKNTGKPRQEDDDGDDDGDDDMELQFRKKYKNHDEDEEVQEANQRLPVRSADGKWVAADSVEEEDEDEESEDEEREEAEEEDGEEQSKEEEGEGEEEGGDFLSDSGSELEMDEYANEDLDSDEEGGSSALQPVVDHEALIQAAKIRIAELCTGLMEDPEKNITHLHRMLDLLNHSDKTIKSLSMISLMSIFKDLAPGYVIRLPTEKEMQQKVSADVKKTRTFESHFLRSYEKYIALLATCTKRIAVSSKRKPGFKKKSPALAVLAARCAAELLNALPHFNMRNALIKIVIPCLNNCIRDAKGELLNKMCDLIRDLFASDVSGEASLEVARRLAQFVKDHIDFIPAQVLDLFTSLPLSVALEEKKEKKESNEHKERRLRGNLALCKDNRSRKKAQKELDKFLEIKKNFDKEFKKKAEKKDIVQIEKETLRDMMEFEGTVDVELKKKKQTELLKLIMVTYLRIVKMSSNKSELLFSALAGISKFAHLINVELVSDFMVCLESMLRRGEMESRTIMQALIATFNIMSGHAAAMKLDLQHFYRYLYTAMSSQSLIPYSEQNARLLLETCEVMLARGNKSLPPTRVAAFIKRICMTTFIVPPHIALGLLHVARSLLISCGKSQGLLDNEQGFDGAYNFDGDDPDLCNALATVLWELSALQTHYHPMVAKYAGYLASIIAKRTSLPPADSLASKKSVMQVVKSYDSVGGSRFSPQIAYTKPFNAKSQLEKKKRKGAPSSSRSNQSLDELRASLASSKK